MAQSSQPQRDKPGGTALERQREAIEYGVEKTRMRQVIDFEEQVGIRRIHWFESFQNRILQIVALLLLHNRWGRALLLGVKDLLRRFRYKLALMFIRGGECTGSGVQHP